MQITVTLTIDSALLSRMLPAIEPVNQGGTPPQFGAVVTAGAPAHLAAPSLRALLVAYGLTARQCDLVLLDLSGYSRAEIAAQYGISPLTVKKYWTLINARLGVQRRQSIRAWALAQYLQHGQPLPGLQSEPPSPRPDPPQPDAAGTESVSFDPVV